MVTKVWGEVIVQRTVRNSQGTEQQGSSHTSLVSSTTESPSDVPLYKDMQLMEQAVRIRCPCTVMLENSRWITREASLWSRRPKAAGGSSSAS